MTPEEINEIYVSLKRIPGSIVKIAKITGTSPQHVLNCLGPREKYTTRPNSDILLAATTVLNEYSEAVQKALESARNPNLSLSN